MLMGIGNLTELTAADSTGVNALLDGGLPGTRHPRGADDRVIPWARGSVREIDVARRLMRHAVAGQTHAEERGRPPGDREGSGGAHLLAGRPARAAGAPSRIPTSASSPTAAAHHGAATHERFVRGTDTQGRSSAQLGVARRRRTPSIWGRSWRRPRPGDARSARPIGRTARLRVGLPDAARRTRPARPADAGAARTP